MNVVWLGASEGRRELLLSLPFCLLVGGVLVLFLVQGWLDSDLVLHSLAVVAHDLLHEFFLTHALLILGECLVIGLLEEFLESIFNHGGVLNLLFFLREVQDLIFSFILWLKCWLQEGVINSRD